MLAEREGVPLDASDIDALVGRMSSLPPHPEVPGALAALARTRLRMVALTNSVQQVAEAQLASAGLSGYFEAVISADSTGHLKPAPQPYRAAAERCGVPVGQVRLVAAHHWDIARALAAGCQAAFVARPGMVLSPARRPARHHRPGPGRGSRADHYHRRVNRRRHTATPGRPPARHPPPAVVGTP
jgi:2-haloacid dehalogenase